MIQYKAVKTPEIEQNVVPVMLSDQTMKTRKTEILHNMQKEGYDAIVMYADLEHGNNFEYLTGFLPRFEEALLILHKDGSAYMALGNENLNKAAYARLEVVPLHMPHFSLPNQPMESEKSVKEILKESGIGKANSIGLVGWKNFTSKHDDNASLFDLPYFIVDALLSIHPKAHYKNATYLFIGEGGARVKNNANEIAHYEFGASLAGACMLETMEAFDLGISEVQLASKLEKYGQKHSVVTIMASGKRFVNANLYPTNNIINKGDAISLTTGYKGGLQSRSGYALYCEDELAQEQKDYLKRIAIPYFEAVKTWLETIHIGMKGSELYDTIEHVLPKETYGWSLNPGHLCADEEWLSSPIYKDSKEIIQSGMLFQIDIIPSVSGYAGASCESGIVLADVALREAIMKEYPQMWERMQKRRDYIREELGIQLSKEILPTSSATTYLRPFLLNKEYALTAR